MMFNSRFGNGDKVWCICGYTDPPQQLTIGQVRIIATNSPGRPGETMFDNFMPQHDYKEEYMCIETGILSGSVFTLGKSIFATKEEALIAQKKYNKDK